LKQTTNNKQPTTNNQQHTDEGYIKYECNWIVDLPMSPDILAEMNQWRNKLYQLGLIGEYDDGIGFGNLSIRGRQPKEFIVSGTHTGSLVSLDERHYTTVVDFDWEKNFVTCRGPIQASSESLTHAAIYLANDRINAVIHVHNLALWQKLMYSVPTTREDCAYGTPEMAREIIRLCQQEELSKAKILVMAGHREGIISFGSNLTEAGNILLEYFSRIERTCLSKL
jgi:ribulose-5-phosphate 4-epimerase/fuculose-1-phosphate aldolase